MSRFSLTSPNSSRKRVLSKPPPGCWVSWASQSFETKLLFHHTWPHGSPQWCHSPTAKWHSGLCSSAKRTKLRRRGSLTHTRIVRDIFYLGISVGFPGTPGQGPIQASDIGGPMSLGVPGASPSKDIFHKVCSFSLIGKLGAHKKKNQQNLTMGADSRFTEYVVSDQFYLLGWEFLPQMFPTQDVRAQR